MAFNLIQVAAKLEGCQDSLQKRCSELDKTGKEKVEAMVEYDKELAIALEQLKAQEVPVTVRKDRAKGILATNGVTLRQGMADIRYEGLKIKIKAAEAAMNAWQTYYRYLDTTVR